MKNYRFANMNKYIKNSKGFTLIELLVTIALMAIILGVAAMKINTGPTQLKAQAFEFCNDVRRLRCLNMTEGQAYKIRIGPDRDYYSVRKGLKVIKRVDLKDGNRFFCDILEITFNHTGAPSIQNKSPDDSLTITIINSNLDDYYQVTIVPSTGRIALKEVEK